MTDTISSPQETQVHFQDRFGRGVSYLRLSLTEACSMRCTYCRPSIHAHPHGAPLLTPADIEKLVSHLARKHGLKKVRLTGGEPTTRHDLVEIIERIARIPAIQDLAMTTNGLTLAQHARDYRQAGLKRINVSLDSLDSRHFHQLTGVDGLQRVLSGLDAAQSAGLNPVRLNTVVVRGHNDADLEDLVRYSAQHGWDLRLIELMPMGPLSSQWHERYVPESEMRTRLSALVTQWIPLAQNHDAARRYQAILADGTQAIVGFITPMSCNFCGACNRIRITSDGTLYPCLMDQPGPSLLPAIKPDFDPSELDRLIFSGLKNKSREHPAHGPTMMIKLGG